MLLPAKHSFTKALYHCPPLPRSGSFASPGRTRQLWGHWHCQTGCCSVSGCWSWTLVSFHFMSTSTCDHREAWVFVTAHRWILLVLITALWIAGFPFSTLSNGQRQRSVSTRFFPCIPGDVSPTFLSHKRMLLSSFFACAFSTVPILFSFRAVAVNSNSCGPVQWRYRASVQSCVPGFGAHLLFVHTQLVHTQFLHTQLGHTQLVCKCPARNSTVQCKSYICSIVTVLSPSHDIGNEQTMARRQAPTMPEWRPHTRDIWNFAQTFERYWHH